MIYGRLKFLLLFLISPTFLISTISFSFAQSSNELAVVTKKIIESKSEEDLSLEFLSLKEIYFKENKYNEFVKFLRSLSQKKKNIAAFTNYYIAFARHSQFKFLEEKQSWDEYFKYGDTYRQEILESLQKCIDSTSAKDPVNIYARLLVWQYRRDLQDNLHEQALIELTDAVLEYAKTAKTISPIKDTADKLFSYGEKSKAKDLYRIYVAKLSQTSVTYEELKNVALSFLKEGNIQLAESVYDIYIEKIIQEKTKEEITFELIEIARLFAYYDDTPTDPAYSEKVFQRIEGLAGKDALSEELTYLRAFNLEKIKEYANSQEIYLDLIVRFPNTKHLNEAVYKIAMIYVYALRDLKDARLYFEKLTLNEKVSAQAISAWYQLGLLSQWEKDFLKAEDYYNKLLEKAGDSFSDTVALAKERLAEIEEEKPMEHNLQTFLDVSLKDEYKLYDMSKSEVKASRHRLKNNQEVRLSSQAYTGESGCMQVELEYLWSGHLGKGKPTTDESAFDTGYNYTGTKEINLVIVGSSGAVDRSLDMLDVD